jgi:hypothetical protein
VTPASNLPVGGWLAFHKSVAGAAFLGEVQLTAQAEPVEAEPADGVEPGFAKLKEGADVAVPLVGAGLNVPAVRKSITKFGGSNGLVSLIVIFRFTIFYFLIFSVVRCSLRI